ncbi:amylovoran biosynthesis protein AmsD [Camelimonas fluminis]|uniref:Glycosyltransferase n=1 Tax=Camelimonas fluminis TaxID=1576911 RepID=A0ABV7UGQ5_9HYPH|nr:glycosyltransferase [Camelimonas fluminis]GHE76970.1 amylovoran biosynthesis protein AmsD [Camelimonas fluminis]
MPYELAKLSFLSMKSEQISTPRLRVLMLIPQLGYGGAEQAFLRVAGFLSQYADVTIALMARDYGNGGYSIEGAQTNLPVVMLGGNQAQKRSLFAKGNRWRIMIRCLQILKSEHDVAISFLSGANLLNALSGPKEKTIVSERGSKRGDTGMSKWERLIWTRFLDPLTYKRAARIVCASSGLDGEIVSNNTGVADKTIALEGTVLVNHLINISDAPVEHDARSLGNGQTIVAFGRLHRQKGFDILLRAFVIVRQSIPTARLLIIGDGPEANTLVTLAQELGLTVGGLADPEAPAVTLAGYREDPIRYLRLGRVVTLTSRFEGLPNALIEALAAGIPVLAADCPWGPRSILAGPSDPLPAVWPVTQPLQLAHGKLMPHPDSAGAVEVWAREIVAALQAPVTRRSQAERREAIARFDIEATGPEWLRLCQDLVMASK